MRNDPTSQMGAVFRRRDLPGVAGQTQSLHQGLEVHCPAWGSIHCPNQAIVSLWFYICLIQSLLQKLAHENKGVNE